MKELGLTRTQRSALEWLRNKRKSWPRNKWEYGFNPPSGQRNMTAAMRVALTKRGFVSIEKISEQHFRYDITEAGLSFLSRLESRQNA